MAIARALINRPPVVLADEPTGNLDTAHRTASIVDLLLGLRDEHGMTIVLATHDSQVAARCDRVVRLRDGRVAEDVDVRAAADVDATIGTARAPGAAGSRCGASSSRRARPPARVARWRCCWGS